MVEGSGTLATRKPVASISFAGQFQPTVIDSKRTAEGL